MYFIRRIMYFIREFHTVWLVFAILLIAGLFAALGCWSIAKRIFIFALGGFLLFILLKPMNIVYGLNGTSGNIRNFIVSVIVFNIIFSLIHFLGFFKNAGICYDINQPYVSFGMFYNTSDTTRSITLQDTIQVATTESISYHISPKKSDTGEVQYDTLIFVSPATTSNHYYKEEHLYNRMKWFKVLQNTLLTSLMQEPTDLFSCCSVYNDIHSPQEQNLNGFNDEESCCFFTWILLVQVFISWIFFGVFISILYNKFRYES